MNTVTSPNGEHSPGTMGAVVRIFALSMVTLATSFILNAILTFWWHWPGVPAFLASFGDGAGGQGLSGSALFLGAIQLAIYVLPVFVVVWQTLRTPERTLHEQAEQLSAFVAYLARAGFWAVLLIGVADMILSFLRVEGVLAAVVGEDLARELGRSQFRGAYVHYPLAVVGMIIAAFTRSLGFPWLALLIVLAEFQIVIARFIFSYEQAFMADLVRFWYGALFLFASAYTLLEEGHVRVDIFYAGFSERGKAWVNAIGSVLLGLPFCWVILFTGMWGKFDVINGPLINYEVTQSGYGMYVKYLLAGFLLVFTYTMLIQFMAYLLSSAAVLLREKGYHPDMSEHISEI